MTYHFRRHGQTLKSNVETGNGISSNYHWGMGPQQRRQHNKVKTVNVAVDWSTNLNAVANGGHGSSLENHRRGVAAVPPLGGPPAHN